MVLGSHGTPVTALRASLVVGPGGTGPELLVDLVRRLPLLLLPPTAGSTTRPIALVDLVRAILHCLGRPEEFDGAFDIGGSAPLSYEQMLRETAQVLGVRRALVKVPFVPLRLASLTARIASGAPAPMVGAIVESLPQDTVMRDNPVQQAIGPGALGFRAALDAAIDPARRRLLPNPRQRVRERDRDLMRRLSLVRSIQRVLLPPGQDAAWVAGNYFRWLGGCCWPMVMTEVDANGAVDVYLRLPRTAPAVAAARQPTEHAATPGLPDRRRIAGPRRRRRRCPLRVPDPARRALHDDRDPRLCPCPTLVPVSADPGVCASASHALVSATAGAVGAIGRSAARTRAGRQGLQARFVLAVIIADQGARRTISSTRRACPAGRRAPAIAGSA